MLAYRLPRHPLQIDCAVVVDVTVDLMGVAMVVLSTIMVVIEGRSTDDAVETRVVTGAGAVTVAMGLLVDASNADISASMAESVLDADEENADVVTSADVAVLVDADGVIVTVKSWYAVCVTVAAVAASWAPAPFGKTIMGAAAGQLQADKGATASAGPAVFHKATTV